MMQRYRGKLRNEMSPHLVTFRRFYDTIINARCCGHVATEITDHCHVCLCKRHASGDDLHHCPFCNLFSHSSCLFEAYEASEESQENWAHGLLDSVLKAYGNVMQPKDDAVDSIL
eukprot:10186257-Karenia_brevis.AAC.1